MTLTRVSYSEEGDSLTDDESSVTAHSSKCIKVQKGKNKTSNKIATTVSSESEDELSTNKKQQRKSKKNIDKEVVTPSVGRRVEEDVNDLQPSTDEDTYDAKTVKGKKNKESSKDRKDNSKKVAHSRSSKSDQGASSTNKKSPVKSKKDIGKGGTLHSVGKQSKTNKILSDPESSVDEESSDFDLSPSKRRPIRKAKEGDHKKHSKRSNERARSSSVSSENKSSESKNSAVIEKRKRTKTKSHPDKKVKFFPNNKKVTSSLSGEDSSSSADEHLKHKTVGKNKHKVAKVSGEKEYVMLSESSDEEGPSASGPDNEKPKKYSCFACYKKFPKSQELFDHTCNGKRKKGFACEYCEKVYKLRSTYLIHKLAHSGKKSRNQMTEDTKHKSNKKEQENDHKKAKEGDEQESDSNAEDSDEEEKRHVVKKSKKKYSCFACHTTFSKTKELFNHTCSQKSEKGFVCEYCYKVYKLRSTYINHKFIHSRKKPYKCEICGHGSPSQSNHLYHMKKLHPEIKPFPCNFPKCSFSFSNRTKQLLHHKLHYQYTCFYCDEKFDKKSTMKSHKYKEHERYFVK